MILNFGGAYDVREYSRLSRTDKLRDNDTFDTTKDHLSDSDAISDPGGGADGLECEKRSRQ